MSYLPHPVTCKLISKLRVPGCYQTTVASMCGLRQTMEDTFAVDYLDNNVLFAAVFDGHGGAGCSTYCQAAFLQAFRKEIQPYNSAKMSKLCKKVDDYFLRSYPSDESGSTATMVAVCPPSTSPSVGSSSSATMTTSKAVGGSSSGNAISSSAESTVLVSNVGDSRTIIIRKGQVVLSTVDHKPSGNPQESKRIRRIGGIVEQSMDYLISYDGMKGLAMTRSIGDRDFKRNGDSDDLVIPEPECMSFKCIDGDLIFLASDGVYDVITNQQIANFICSGLRDSTNLAAKSEVSQTSQKQAEKVLCDLLDHCVALGSSDNITAILVQIMNSNTTKTKKTSDSSSSSSSSILKPQTKEEEDCHANDEKIFKGLDFAPGLFLASFGNPFVAAYLACVKSSGLTMATALEKRCIQLQSMKSSRSGTMFQKQEKEYYHDVPSDRKIVKLYCNELSAQVQQIIFRTQKILARMRSAVHYQLLKAMLVWCTNHNVAEQQENEKTVVVVAATNNDEQNVSSLSGEKKKKKKKKSKIINVVDSEEEVVVVTPPSSLPVVKEEEITAEVDVIDVVKSLTPSDIATVASILAKNKKKKKNNSINNNSNSYNDSTVFVGVEGLRKNTLRVSDSPIASSSINSTDATTASTTTTGAFVGLSIVNEKNNSKNGFDFRSQKSRPALAEHGWSRFPLKKRARCVLVPSDISMWKSVKKNKLD